MTAGPLHVHVSVESLSRTAEQPSLPLRRPSAMIPHERRRVKDVPVQCHQGSGIAVAFRCWKPLLRAAAPRTALPACGDPCLRPAVPLHPRGLVSQTWRVGGETRHHHPGSRCSPSQHSLASSEAARMHLTPMGGFAEPPPSPRRT